MKFVVPVGFRLSQASQRFRKSCQFSVMNLYPISIVGIVVNIAAFQAVNLG